MKSFRHLFLLLLAAVCLHFAPAARAANVLVWDAKQSHLSASVEAWPLEKLLDDIAAKTGWEIYFEPGSDFTASAKFKNLPLGDGLRALLGNLSFALVPQTNAPSRLYVFHTTMQAATQLVAPVAKPRARDGAKPIPNELIVTVKPGVDIEALAKKLGGKVTGRVEGLNTYRLQFDTPEAAQAALALLNANPDVASVDYNYELPKPSPKTLAAAGGGAELPISAKAIGADGKVTVGLVDNLGGDASSYCGLSDFMLPPLNVAGDTAPIGSSPSHGYSMAATIVRGVASVKNSSNGKPFRILPVDVFGKNATTTTFDVANGIYRAVNAGANPINLSLGSAGDSAFLESVIARAQAQGVVFFAAAGNEPVATPTYPAAYPGVVAVTAGDRQGNIASYANYGSFVDAVGPSGNVVCYDGQSWMVQGTSTATAFATGIGTGAAVQGATGSQVATAVENALKVNPQ